MLIFIENLAGSSCVKLLILWVRGTLRTKDLHLYYFDASVTGLRLACYLTRIFSARIEKFNFRYDDLVDDEKVNMGMKILYEDLQYIWTCLAEGGYFDGKFNSRDKNDWLLGYVKKKLTIGPWPGSESRESLINILLMLKAAKSKALNSNGSKQTFFLMKQRLWMTELSGFSAEMDIKLVAVDSSFALLKNKIFKYSSGIRELRLSNIFRKTELREDHRSKKVAVDSSFALLKNKIPNSLGLKEPKIVVDQAMHFFLASTFWSASELAPKSVLFVSKGHNIGDKELEDIRKSGMNFIALSPQIAQGLDVPIYQPHNQSIFSQQKSGNNESISLEEIFVAKYVDEFIRKKKYWSNLFKTVGAKVYATHHKWSAIPVAAADAIKEMRGISALWQTSYYEKLVPYASVYTDVYFPFSTEVAAVEEEMGSSIKYNIAVGYTRDYMFELLKDRAIRLRNKLQNQGCKKVISFFDQGSSDDERWNISHSTVQSDYMFWLNKVLKEKWLGLIIKPKKPGTLRTRLGDTATLLDKAVETGRCHIFWATQFGKNYYDPPALCALASDFAIHNMLSAATAGVEAALTGTPTLLFDRFEWRRSRFYELGVGKVVFNDWGNLWSTLTEHWEKGPIPGFGDWSPIIEDLDPFRDGKAAYRMTTYLHWLIQGFKQSLDRETIMADAAERYAKEWGDDKVVCMS